LNANKYSPALEPISKYFIAPEYPCPASLSKMPDFLERERLAAEKYPYIMIKAIYRMFCKSGITPPPPAHTNAMGICCKYGSRQCVKVEFFSQTLLAFTTF